VELKNLHCYKKLGAYLKIKRFPENYGAYSKIIALLAKIINIQAHVIKSALE
jgi:hypothetical protein